jgi:hypothetical protein
MTSCDGQASPKLLFPLGLPHRRYRPKEDEADDLDSRGFVSFRPVLFALDSTQDNVTILIHGDNLQC